ncbi:MAG TPA: hypothetical protein VIU12_21330 [Chryseolinea sp.]
MKKITLFFASALFLGATSLYAQSQDSTATHDKSSKTQSSTSSSRDDQSQNYTKNMSKIQSSEVPANLRTTLQGTQYKGWEKGTIYRSKNNDGYAIEFKDGNKTKTYRFDGEGKPMDPKD